MLRIFITGNVLNALGATLNNNIVLLYLWTVNELNDSANETNSLNNIYLTEIYSITRGDS